MGVIIFGVYHTFGQFPGRSCLLKILKENGEKKDFDSKVVIKTKKMLGLVKRL